MARIIFLSLFAFFASGAYAQRHGGTGGPPGAQPGRGAPPSGFSQPGRQPDELRQRPFWGGFANEGNRSQFPYGFGYGWMGDGLYPDDSDEAYPPPQAPAYGSPFPPAPPSIMFPARPQPIHGVIHDYTASSPAPATVESATFGIVLKDGSVRAAVAVVVDDDGLKYTDPDGRNVSLSLYAVDRDATRSLNRQRNLKLWLPAAP